MSSEDFSDLFGEEDASLPAEGDAIDRMPASLLPGFSGDVKEKYRALVRTVCQKHLDWSPEQAIEEIRRAEVIHNYSFHQFRNSDPPDSPGGTLARRRALQTRKMLDILEGDEPLELEAIETVFANMIEHVSLATGDPPEEVERNFIDLSTIAYRVGLQSRAEIRDILINGPQVEGFESTTDPSYSNVEIRRTFQDLFGERMYRRANIVRVSKDDQYLIHRTHDDDEHIREGNELVRRGLVTRLSNMLVANDRASYLEAEQYLEHVNDPEKLQHTYKLRAAVSGSTGYSVIHIKSFGVERPRDYDYLSDLEEASEEEKMRLYILSTIVHEFAHAFELQIPRTDFQTYQDIIEEESAPELRTKFVSDYVLRHKELYRSGENLLAREDIAETIRIYTVNPGYLERHYPRRLAFIKQHFPFIKMGGLRATNGA
jgi:hypothetical protein